MDLVNSMRLGPYGLTYERYQQVFGGAKVLGGQLTLYRDDSGAVTTVIGAQYSGVVPTNAARLTAAEARGIVDRDIGPGGERITDLMIDPRSGRYFFRVETRRPDSRWVLWVGAQGGQVLNKFDALAHTCNGAPPPCGYGVEFDNGFPEDVKDLAGLTIWDACLSAFTLWTQDDRQGTFDEHSTNLFSIPIAESPVDSWVLLGDEWPAQQALVDAHFYGRITDQYYLDRHGYDWVAAATADPGMPYNFIPIVAHSKYKYNNASWNGRWVSLGDGDQVKFRELVALDVVAHELTHAVTDFTSNLIYQNESGALNEAFSDIIGANVEFYADDPDGDGVVIPADRLEPSAGVDPDPIAPFFEPDWFMGEEFDLQADTVPGIRNMKDPEEDAANLSSCGVIVKHPDHYGERYTGTCDNGGVHVNSGIPNHAYYLLVNGGLNASCASPGDHDSVHCTGGIGDVGSPVTGIAITDAERIYLMALMALSSDADMCAARAATEASAETLFGAGSQQALSTTDAWVAVGLTDDVCPDPLVDNPPSVTIMEPTSGTEVSGKRSKVVADASDDNGVTNVYFYITGDSTPVCSDSDGSNGWSCRWDTKGYTDGEYDLTAVAWDGASPSPQSATSDPMPVMVKNSKDDGGGGPGGGGGGEGGCKGKNPKCTK